ncbi:MAG TPA: hypothetical protein VIV40_12520 [Kofleriaceae bacterium]
MTPHLGIIDHIQRKDRQELVPVSHVIQTSRMTVSRLRVAKSETRDMAEHDRIVRSLHTSEWHMSNATFFTAFVAIAAGLAVVALLLR